ncbi:acyltransferase family protein [Paenarthrobacter nicotinovorans]|uniref:acyltransferase family protein n=1 Tax=Paenarthrobacter nicotinovorans TaxID=29320 RepID=UPI003D675ABF
MLLFHAGVPWLPGGFIGVDVFFVISGFLITTGIVKEIRTKGKLSLKGFYARRAVRILPAATVALVGVVVLSFLVLPITRWLQIGKDAAASGVYIVNWLFANSAVDYMARDAAPSPFQHFWSLSVEEQFYLVWPLLLMCAAGLAKRLGKERERAFLVALAIIAVPSLAWSVFMTATNPGAAYFVTTTRMWELAVGAGLAITASSVNRIPKAVAAIVGWLGLAAIVASAVLYTSELPFPSYTALLPTLGAAGVIWAGPLAGTAGPGVFLGIRPMVAIGGVSYSLYLWHWPLIVFAGALFGTLSPTLGLIVVVVSFIPAWLSLKFVEKPALEWSKFQNGTGNQLQLGGLATLGAVTAAVILAVMVPPTPAAPSIDVSALRQQNAVSGRAEPIGAEVLFAAPATNTAVDSFKSLTPNVVEITNDVPIVNKNGCMQDDDSTEAVKCSFGDTKSSKVIALIGDSHAAMLIPGFSSMAQRLGWRVDTYTKGACPFVTNTVTKDGKPFDSCRQWGENVTTAVLADSPQVVVTAMSRYRVIAGTTLSFEDSVEPLAQGLHEAWQPFLARSIPVFAMRDTPRPDVQVADCIARNQTALTKCAWPKAQVLFQDPPEARAVRGLPGTSLVDLTPAICPQDMCPSVIGGVVVYRDNNHLTATFAQSLHDHLGAALASAVK